MVRLEYHQVPKGWNRFGILLIQQPLDSKRVEAGRVMGILHQALFKGWYDFPRRAVGIFEE